MKIIVAFPWYSQGAISKKLLVRENEASLIIISYKYCKGGLKHPEKRKLSFACQIADSRGQHFEFLIKIIKFGVAEINAPIS